jgi:hypothetical protein
MLSNCSFPSLALHSRDPKLCRSAAPMSQTDWTLTQMAVAGQSKTPHLEALDRQQSVSKYVYEDYSLLGYQADNTSSHDVFIIYCGEGRRHILVSSRVQSCSINSLSTFELRRLPSGPTGHCIYCINLVTPCICNKAISLHILFNPFSAHEYRLLRLLLKIEAVYSYWQHGHNPDDNFNLITHFNFLSVKALKNHFHFDLISFTKKYQGREISVNNLLPIVPMVSEFLIVLQSV